MCEALKEKRQNKFIEEIVSNLGNRNQVESNLFQVE